MEPQGQPRPPTDYGAYVLEVLNEMTRRTSTIDQATLRHCLGLSSSYLVADTATNPTGGVVSWSAGFNRLVDVLVALHARGELELETVNAASKACSECWTVAGNWRGLDECREGVRRVAVRLKRLLDENGRTFGGERVYVP
ncbi:hypothetical protein BC834DRAFT_880525 [Gloeopeniophorella convolvens]|nr:hypothetical protein BC834DRAFT_880525 [Gloeopeniophorella convolvens]